MAGPAQSACCLSVENPSFQTQISTCGGSRLEAFVARIFDEKLAWARLRELISKEEKLS